MLFESITRPFEGNCEVFEVWHQLAHFLPQSDAIAGKNEDDKYLNSNFKTHTKLVFDLLLPQQNKTLFLFVFHSLLLVL